MTRSVDRNWTKYWRRLKKVHHGHKQVRMTHVVQCLLCPCRPKILVSVRDRCIAHLKKAHGWNEAEDSFSSSDSDEPEKLRIDLSPKITSWTADSKSSEDYDSRTSEETVTDHESNGEEEEFTINDQFICDGLNNLHSYTDQFDSSVFDCFDPTP